MADQTYRGLAYRQATSKGAPWLVTFVAIAEDITAWVGIPRRSSDKSLVGFQRLEDQTRAEKAQKFFEDPNNQSPTALIVGIHQMAPGIPQAIELVFDDGSEG